MSESKRKPVQMYEFTPPEEGAKKDDGDKVSPAEKRARDNGWLPKEEYDGDDWIGAEAFNVRAEVIGQVLKQKKANESLRSDLAATKKQLDEVTSLHERMLEKEIAKQKKSLKKEKIEAQESGDYKRVSDIEDEMEDLEKIETPSTSTQAKKQPTVPQAIKDWYDKHGDAMLSNEDFKEAADAYALAYAKKAGDQYDATDAVEFVDKRLKKMFPEEYGSTKRKATPTPENDDIGGGSKSTTKDKKYTLSQCNDYEKSVAKRMAEQLGITPTKYVNEYLAKENLLEVQQRG